jgi:hypothetical protein
MVSSASTRTPTSIDVRQAALTVARKLSTSPVLTGSRTRTPSTAAVTTRDRQWRVAAMTAASSSSLRIQPPWTSPAALASRTDVR